MVKKVAALICVMVLIVESLGVTIGDIHAASIPVTGSDASFNLVSADNGIKGNRSNNEISSLEFGEKAEGKILSSEEGQQYQITLRSSGKLTICLEGEDGKLSGRLTDEKGKGWGARGTAAGGTYTWQLKKGTYYYQVSAAKNIEIPPTGLEYIITAKFKSARAKYEYNTTRKKAAQLPLNKTLYGHLAQNASCEYYKFTLKKMAPIAITLDTQIDERTPETFIVSLYNKNGKMLGNWRNPDWSAYEDDGWYGSWIQDEGGNYEGLTGVLEAGTYYVSVTVERDENGKVLKSARYGKFAIRVTSWELPVSLELSHDKAEYTGKKLKLPKMTLTEYPDSPYYKEGIPVTKDKYDVKDYNFIYDMETGKKLRKIRKIGKYCFTYGIWPETNLSTYACGEYAYVVFTVTPVQGKINRISSRKKGQVGVALRKDTPSTGYEIQIARDKNFKKSIKTIKSSETRKTIKGLLSGKKYYIRVRNYKDVDIEYLPGTKIQESIYGAWSRTKEIVCK